MATNNSDKPDLKELGVELSINEEDQSLNLIFTPTETEVDPNTVFEHIESTYDELKILDEAKQSLSKSFTDKQAITLVVARPPIPMLSLEVNEAKQSLAVKLEHSLKDPKDLWSETPLTVENLETHISENFEGYLFKEDVIKPLSLAIENKQDLILTIATLKPVLVSLAYDEDKNELSVNYELGEEALTNQITINMLIEESEFKEFALDSKAVTEAQKQLNERILEPIVIGSKEHAKATITLSEDNLEAYITLTPPQGGDEMTLDSLKTELSGNKITEIVEDSLLKEALENAYEAPQLIAKGKPYIEGTDAQFIEKIAQREKGPKEGQNGKVDMRELQEFIIVEPETVLMERIPAVPGTNGVDVYGNAVMAPEVQDTPFSEYEGSEIKVDDNIVTAVIKGHPIFHEDGVAVDNCIQLENVDIETGNVTFDGSLLITGDIMEGMKVKATGDIVIKGSVYASEIEAEGHISIAGGAVGSKEGGEEAHLDKYNTVIIAKGNIEIGFVNLAEVESKQSITVYEYVYHSYLYAEGKILLGQPKGKGLVLGGSIQGEAGVECNLAGNHTEIKTLILAGLSTGQLVMYQHNQEEYNTRYKELLQLGKILDKVRKAPVQKLGEVELQRIKKISQVFLTLKNEIDTIKLQMLPTEQMLDQLKDITITIHKEANPGCLLKINGGQFKIKEELKKLSQYKLVGKTIKEVSN